MAELANLHFVSPSHYPSLLECVGTLAQVAAALQLRDVSAAALAATALQATQDAQRAQDSEEAAFEAGRHLSQQIAALQRVLVKLHQLADELSSAGGDSEAAAASATTDTAEYCNRTAKYVVQQQKALADLEGAGLSEEVRQFKLQARGAECVKVSAELSVTENALERYGGLPADATASQAIIQERRQELHRLRRQLQQHLDSLDS